MRAFLTAILLALTYLAVVGHWSAADVIVSLVVGIFVTFLFGRFQSESAPGTVVRVLALPWLLVGVALELFRGSWTMLLVLTGLKTWKNVGYAEVPYGARTPRGVLVTALIASASPGSLLIKIDDKRRVMLFNVIDASDPHALRRGLDRFYDRFQRWAVP